MTQRQRARFFKHLPQRVQQPFQNQTQLNISAQLRLGLQTAFEHRVDFLRRGLLCQRCQQGQLCRIRRSRRAPACKRIASVSASMRSLSAWLARRRCPAASLPASSANLTNSFAASMLFTFGCTSAWRILRRKLHSDSSASAAACPGLPAAKRTSRSSKSAETPCFCSKGEHGHRAAARSGRAGSAI